ncbi:prospero homeobox protein 1-like [Cheilinus undulatus]|uniref:prospero homeobox protein 1-like n=1 Tax=Cheilinus undulatus TaxID=241271 RepID=UPI001BD48AB9|nr:prospero homeobox protein 1-like [Cheilinus undulatus]
MGPQPPLISRQSKGMYYSSNICPGGRTAEHLSSLQPDLSLTDRQQIKMFHEQTCYSSSDACSMVTCSSQQELNLARDNGHVSTKRHPSDASSSCGHPDWYYNSGHRAKRARVESIIKGMVTSPGMQHTDLMTNQYVESGSTEENERIQELPLHQGGSRSDGVIHSQKTQEHPESQLKTRFVSMDAVNDTSGINREEQYLTWKDSLETTPGNESMGSFNELESSSRKLQGWKKVKLMSYFQSKPERMKLISDVLKYELSRAVSRSVDSIFKSMPLLQTSAIDGGNLQTDLHLYPTGCKDNNPGLMCNGNAEMPIQDTQTEALSLVVPKPRLQRDMFPHLSKSRGHYNPKTLVPLSKDSVLHEEELSEETTHHHALHSLQDEVGPVKFEKFNTHWNSVKVRSKVNSRSVRKPHTHTVSVDPLFLESLSLPHVKIESDRLVKNQLYMPNEGLTTSHLKKAKLMFFYTRYPSSMVLKMCFHDVQFTRCITSQLIKWFSNFREFFYIQMEKFARHALVEGSTDVRGLTVERESELFRTLNTHYNKANDFNVPDRFLEVAEITLREFFIAISLGKDCDPSWKKAIYKVICKLDSDVPTEFKHHHSG